MAKATATCTKDCVPKGMGLLKKGTVYDFPDGIPKGMEVYFKTSEGTEKATVAKAKKFVPPVEVPQGLEGVAK